MDSMDMAPDLLRFGALLMAMVSALLVAGWINRKPKRLPESQSPFVFDARDHVHYHVQSDR